MKYLLDTCSTLWYAYNSPKLSKTALSVIRNENAEKFVSVASCWEVAIKSSLKKDKFANEFLMKGGVEEFYKAIKFFNFTLIKNIKDDYVKIVETLPFHHRDPFDRLIIATAMSQNLTIITADENIQKYNVNWIWD